MWPFVHIFTIPNDCVGLRVNMTFGSRILSIRKKQKLAQNELALKIGVYANVLRRYERDKALPSVEVAAKIAQALDVSLDYLSGIANVELDSSMITRITEITAMPDEEQQQVYKVVDALIRDHKSKQAYKK